MAISTMVVCNADFDWSGIEIHVGDTFADTHIFYTKFPSKFDRVTTAGIATSLTGGTLGTVIAGKVPVVDYRGSLVGLMPIYNTITGT